MGSDKRVLDVVVTVPKSKWAEWVAEGDLAGEEWGNGDAGPHGEYVFTTRQIFTEMGARLYIVAYNRVRGYAPITGLAWAGKGKLAIYRQGEAVAVTIPERVKGFQGARHRWWSYEDEVPFPDWQTADVE